MSGDGVVRRCVGITRKGERCRGRAMKGRDYCVAHRWGTPPPTPPRNGEGSQGRGSDPRSGEGGQGRGSDPRYGEGLEVGFENTDTAQSMTVFQAQPVKALQTIEDVVEDMLQRQSQLTMLIEEKTLGETINVSEVSKLLALHGQNGSRIGRLLRDQRALSGASMDGLLDAIGRALDELSTELGVEL